MTNDAPDDAQDAGSANELLGEVAHHLTVLIRSDLELAAAQRAPEIREVVLDTAAAGAAAAAALLAFAAASWAAVLGLSHAMASWGAALVVAGAWALVTLILLRTGGVTRLRGRLSPGQQEQSLVAARRTRDEAEQAIKVAAGQLGRAVVRETAEHEMGAIVEAEQRIADTVERDVEAILRDLVTALSVPERAGSFLGRLKNRGRP
jgi:putative superfamily III holin-X